MHLKIHTAALQNHEQVISNSAADTVRMGFNPSSLPSVDALKAMAAAMITHCEGIREEGGAGAREAAVAITQIQGACMFAVAAATADLG